MHYCKTPDCNRPVAQRHNSTIKSEYCPACTLSRVKIKKASFFDRFKTVKGKKSEKTLAMNRADKHFSLYIRLTHSFEMNGERFCKCYTCGSIKAVNNIDCGHYHGRGNKLTRYHEDNSRPQCKKCNRFQSGKHTEFGNNLLAEIGAERFEEIRLLALSSESCSIDFYEETANKYRNLLKTIK